MNENEFEKLLKDAMKDESSPSDILNVKLKQKIKKRYFIQNSFSGIKTAVACVAVLVTGTLILVNSNEGISNRLSDIPVVGNIAKVMTVNDFNKKDIVSQDNDILYTTENRIEDDMGNTTYNFEKIIETAQGDNKTKPTTQKNNKTSEKQAETNIPKTEDFNNKTEVKEIEKAPVVVNETMENDMYSPSVARAIDSHSDQQFDIWQGETTDEEALKTEESAKSYEKLSDLYDEGYDYKKVISEKIKNQAKERMTLNLGIEYNIGDDFVITGDEEFYINDKNELVIVFGEGVVAPKESGKIEFNIGVIN